MTNRICFFIGTEAELIKLFPLILLTEKRNTPYCIIASGQNNILKSRVLAAANGGKVAVELSKETDIHKSTMGLFLWFLSTAISAKKSIMKALPDVSFKGSIMVVHGDTVSTLMGAWLGKRLHMKVAHIEAGLRSHNYFNPFPEEIDRVLTSKFSDISFAPGKDACENLKRVRTEIVDTCFNTVIDSLAFSESNPCEDESIKALLKKDYFVFVMHRQENLANSKIVSKAVNCVREVAQKRHCVFILHKLTEVVLEKLGLLEDLQNDSNITLLPRKEYFDFMKLLANSQFVITDGGSNQEELCYMGKPCLILRSCTERSDGIGENAVLYSGEMSDIKTFADNYNKYARDAVKINRSPSDIILNELLKKLSLE